VRNIGEHQQQQRRKYPQKMRYESLGKIRHNGLHPSTGSPLLCPIRRPNCSRRMYGLSNELTKILVSNRRVPAREFVQQAAPRSKASVQQVERRRDEGWTKIPVMLL
jgi:hypothetical protein